MPRYDRTVSLSAAAGNSINVGNSIPGKKRDLKGRWYVHGQRDITALFVAAEGDDVRVSLNTSYHPTTDKVTPALTVVGYTQDV